MPGGLTELLGCLLRGGEPELTRIDTRSYGAMPVRLFVSHSSRDAELAERLVELVRAHGYVAVAAGQECSLGAGADLAPLERVPVGGRGWS